MNKNSIRAAVAAAALAPMIALGSGVATSAPAEQPAPVQVAPASEQAPVQVEPAVLFWNPLLWWVCFVPPIFPFGTGICLV
ncbi:hypothetical protein ACQP1G_30075 [Nocardia sp. CA-107356]|uniref:hypothetical protein n=1 Tax=Nocardia sp. CA-107356 TaxID=3239972 RepID=UPI003D91820F